jgi:hypothetical protein
MQMIERPSSTDLPWVHASVARRPPADGRPNETCAWTRGRQRAVRQDTGRSHAAWLQAPNVEVERGTQAQLEAVRSNAGLGARKAARLHLAARQNDTDDTRNCGRRQRQHRRARRRVKLNPLAATANRAERSHCPTKPELPAQRDAEHEHHRFDRAFACRIPNA